MRAITVRQPWAWAIIHGGKDVENRTRNIAGSYRGPVAIHAGLAAFEQHNLASLTLREAHGSETPTYLAFGAIIGVVDLVDVLPPSYYDRAESDEAWCSAWAMKGHHQLVLENPRPLPAPIPYRGALGLWNLPDDVIAAVTR
jgi:hypothetical protein